MMLITGANGFVGSALCTEVRLRGIDLRAVTRDGQNGTCKIGEITPSTNWSKFVDGVDVVIHLAAKIPASNVIAQNELSDFRAVNVCSTLNLAKQAAASGVKRFVFLSSIKVNGEETELDRPFTSFDRPRPEDAYGVSKFEAEEALFEFAKTTQMNVVVIRPPLIYGPGVKGNFYALLKIADRGFPLPVGGIKSLRSLLYIGNLNDFILHCCTSMVEDNCVFLVSDDEDVSIGDLMKALANEMGSQPIILPVPKILLEKIGALVGMKSTVRRLVAPLQVDVAETFRVTGWQPRFTFKQGIRETVQSFARRRG